MSDVGGGGSAMVAMLGTFRLGEVGGLVGVRFVLLVGDCGVFLNRFRGSARWGHCGCCGVAGSY